ncbi:MAG: dienelactone hydrolase family protein [Dehalococcoidia bacterium]
MKSIRWSAFALALLLASSFFLQACGRASDTTAAAHLSSATATATALDPAAPGPYPVGVTELTFERVSSTTGEPRVLQTVVWYPAVESARGAAADPTLKGARDAALAGDGRPLAVIIFSHGSGGVPWQSTFYTAHLASYGFVVVAPPHPGNTLNDCFPCTNPADLVDSFINRPADVTFVLESMLKLNADPASMFYNALDSTRVGMSGHSFGGLDTLEFAAKGTDSPFAAALALAPEAGKSAPAPRGEVDIPLMIMGGDRDNVCPVKYDQTFFDSVSASTPHFLVVFPKGGHTAYSDPCVPLMGACGPDDLNQERAHELVNFYATAFFETYVAKVTGYEGYLTTAAAEGDPDVRFTAIAP